MWVCEPQSVSTNFTWRMRPGSEMLMIRMPCLPFELSVLLHVALSPLFELGESIETKA